jgi:hypothetical protein
MTLLESAPYKLAPYRIGEPVYEVKASPRIEVSETPCGLLDGRIEHCFYPVKGFDFMRVLPEVAVTAKAPEALRDALEDFCNGFYYCLIKDGVIVSMQYVRDESHVRMVED